MADYAYIGMGANLPSSYGSPLETLHAAISTLEGLSVSPLRCSSFWQSEPLDCPPDSPVFTNAVVGLIPHNDETPHSFLEKLQNIENKFGRSRSGLLNEARVLDLDLLVFKSVEMSEEKLTLPHPRMHERLFVLAPLSELSADLLIAGQQFTVKDLVKTLADQSIYRL